MKTGWAAAAVLAAGAGLPALSVELSDADHFIYLNNEAVVVREMREFLLGKDGD